MALPFVMGETSVAMYLEKSRLTGEGKNNFAYEADHFNYIAAEYSHSIFWRFLSEETYYTREKLAVFVKPATLGLNIYHFFIRKNCLPTCLNNLFNTFTSKETLDIKTAEQLRLTVEIIVLGYLVGVVIMPGAHIQF